MTDDRVMSLEVSEAGKFVELITDTSIATYGEWIPGEGGDICLLRCRETKHVVGVCLPLRCNRLMLYGKSMVILP